VAAIMGRHKVEEIKNIKKSYIKLKQVRPRQTIAQTDYGRLTRGPLILHL
jgi:hypothetical protein